MSAVCEVLEPMIMLCDLQPWTRDESPSGVALAKEEAAAASGTPLWARAIV